MLVYKQQLSDGEESFFDSSNVVYIRYQDSVKKMDIIYKSGKQYLYHDVPKNIYYEIRDSKSQGQKINEMIIKKGYGKELYKEEKINILDTVTMEYLYSVVNRFSKQK